MNKRYQVFVSSTYTDLVDERLEVIKALLELDCIPCGMEYFPAASEDSWSYIANLIDQCDYYVVIVGGRYGSMTPEGISFTQKEYAHAQTKKIPSIAFIHAKPEELPSKKTEQTDDGRQKLGKFIIELKRHLCKEWSTSHELGGVVSRSITQLIKRHPRTGWIPADQASDPETTKEILVLTKKVSDLENQLKRSKGKQSADTAELADGEDTFPVHFKYAVSAKSKNKGWDHYEICARCSATIELTFNETYRIIAPRISPMAEDSNIRVCLNNFLKGRFTPTASTIAKDQRISSVTVTDESYNVIRIQFIALGLVTAAKELRDDGSHTGIIWRLTERGEARMQHSLAIKKPSFLSPKLIKKSITTKL